MFNKLQKEHKEWSIKNFGEQDIEDYQLGLIEEVGELAHSVLKRKQGIRNNENHDEMIKDAIGDITIYLIGFCNCKNIDIEKVNINTYSIENSIVSQISYLISDLIKHRNLFCVIHLLSSLKSFCKSENIDYEQTVLDTWKNVVQKRDWKENPDCIENNIITNGGINYFNSKINLCEFCIFKYPECECNELLFGDGIGKDNIIKCDCFEQNSELCFED